MGLCWGARWGGEARSCGVVCSGVVMCGGVVC